MFHFLELLVTNTYSFHSLPNRSPKLIRQNKNPQAGELIEVMPRLRASLFSMLQTWSTVGLESFLFQAVLISYYTCTGHASTVLFYLFAACVFCQSDLAHDYAMAISCYTYKGHTSSLQPKIS